MIKTISKTGLTDIGCVTAVFMLFLMVFLMAQPVIASETFYTTTRVNLRTGPGTDTDIIKTVALGAELQIDEYNPSGWSKVRYNDLSGYMKSEFISASKPENPTPSGVVLMEWSEARNVVKVGVPIAVYDVYSGLTYYIKSFSNGMHADVEPITTEDTAIMKRTYGGTWSWDGRPVWVTVGNVTIAAAINGMPHGGGVNGNNGMNGQICLHFKNSTVHNGNMRYSNELQWTVQTAYNLSK